MADKVLKVGDWCEVVGNTHYGHNFNMGDIVEIKSTDFGSSGAMPIIECVSVPDYSSYPGEQMCHPDDLDPNSFRCIVHKILKEHGTKEGN